MLSYRALLGVGFLGFSSFSMAVGCLGGERMNENSSVPGAEGQTCRPDGSCDPGLSCFSNLCVNAGSTAAGTGGAASGATGSGGTDASGGTDGSTGGTTGSGGTTTGEGGGGGEGDSTGGTGGTSPGFPHDPECRTEGSYLICGHAGFTWHEAQAYCQSVSKNLVKIENNDENTALVEAVTETGSVWIGANDLQMEDDFRWPDGSEVIDADANWADGQPNNSESNENCVVLHSDGGDWNDVACTSTEFGDDPMSFVCE